MTNDELTEAARGIIGEAMGRVAQLEGSAILGTWVILLEQYDEDGDAWLMRLGSEDSNGWTRMGMLTAALASEKASWTEPS